MTASSAPMPTPVPAAGRVAGPSAGPAAPGALPERGHGPAAATLVRAGLRESVPWFLATLGFVAFLIVGLYFTGWVRLEGFDLPTPSSGVTGGLPIVLFVYALVTPGAYLRPVLAAGATRGAVLRGWLVLSAVLAAVSVALVSVLAVAEGPFGAGRWAPAGGPGTLPVVVLPLFVACFGALVSGGLIVLTYLRLPWWAATLLLPLTSPVLALVLVAAYAIAETGPVRLGVAVPVVLAVLGAQIAFGWVLGRSMPVKPGLDRP